MIPPSKQWRLARVLAYSLHAVSNRSVVSHHDWRRFTASLTRLLITFSRHKLKLLNSCILSCEHTLWPGYQVPQAHLYMLQVQWCAFSTNTGGWGRKLFGSCALWTKTYTNLHQLLVFKIFATGQHVEVFDILVTCQGEEALRVKNFNGCWGLL